MTAKAYGQLLGQCMRLSTDERIEFVAVVTELVAQSDEERDERSPRSILELDGLGKEIWHGIDPDEYIREEHRSWDG